MHFLQNINYNGVTRFNWNTLYFETYFRSSTLDESDEHVWYPIQKVDQAKRKLQGASSTTILVEDLNSSIYKSQKPDYFKAYVSLVKGDQEFDKRAR